MKKAPGKPKKKMTLETLAAMVARGFESMRETMATKEDLKKQIDHIDNRLDIVDMKINGINNRLDDLADNRAKRSEVYDLGLRVTKVEQKIKMKK